MTVHLVVAPALSLCTWAYLSLKMNGNSCSAKIFKGYESEAVKLKRYEHVKLTVMCVCVCVCVCGGVGLGAHN